jgi:hypothetical protein
VAAEIANNKISRRFFKGFMPLFSGAGAFCLFQAYTGCFAARLREVTSARHIFRAPPEGAEATRKRFFDARA